MLSAENWCLKVEQKVYGPYSTEQMRKFAHEGRLASWSLISPAGGQNWREARKETVFSNFFGVDKLAPKPTKTIPIKSFGKRSDSDNAGREGASHATGNADTDNANFLVIFDVVSGAASRVEAAMMSLGHAFRIADNVWNVSSDMTAVGVRNAIAPYLRGSESIFVVDASRGRTAWRNYAPEPHAKLSAAYQKSKQS